MELERTMRIKLRNNRWMEAEPLPGDIYQVQLASGRVKMYSISDILEIDDDDGDESIAVVNESDNNNMSKEKPVLYHYMNHVKDLDVVLDAGGPNEKTVTIPVYNRIITDHLDPATLADYTRSLETKRVVNSTMAISTGNWKLHLLEQRLCKSGVPFVIEIWDHETFMLREGYEALIASKVEHANFAYASSTQATYLYGATIEDLGLTATHMKKLAKRLMEITRLSEMALHLDEPFIGQISIETFIPDEKEDPKLYDGISFIRRSLAIDACRIIKDPIRRNKLVKGIRKGEINRLMVRFMNDGWLMKGDMIICPDEQINADIITVDDNLKSEIRTNGFAHLTIWEHHPRHSAVWDDQSSINFAQALPERKQIHDINRLRDQLFEKLELGEIPSWMLLGEVPHNDDGTVAMEQLSDRLRHNYMRAQLNLGDAANTWLQNQLYLWMNSVHLRMTKSRLIYSRVTKMSARKKHWVPMTNAVLGSVVTYEALTKMGNFTFPNQDPNKVFWDDRFGLVIPGKRFIETYPLKGGWDQDDSVKAVWVKAFASADISHLLGNALPSGLVLPEKAEDAIDLLFLVRSPNGPGEYNFELFNPDGMFDEDMLDPEWVTTLDISLMPLPQHLLLESVKVTGMPTSTVYTKTDLEKAQMIEMIIAQTQNPGVGAYCNAIMVYWYTMRRFPLVMLDIMETIVDTLQQGYDVVAFDAIREETENIWEQLYRACRSNPKYRIERTLATTRMSIERQMKFDGLFVEGRFTRVHRHYERVVNEIHNKTVETTKQWRWNNPIVRRLDERPFDIRWTERVKHLYTGWNNRLEAVDAEYEHEKKAITNPITGKPHPFGAMVLLENKSNATHAIVDEMVKHFDQIKDEDARYRLCLNIYKWVVLGQSRDPKNRHRLGLSDRIFFQPNRNGERCLMDVLIEAVKYFGIVG